MMNAADSQPAREEEILTFNIFQCKSCRTIIGDTSTLQVFNRETSFLTVQKKSDNVTIDSELETSKKEFDYGSTFNNLNCKNCNEVLGRTYRTTTPELDNIRGRFSFNINSLIMFEIPGIDQPQNVISDQNSTKSSEVDYIEITKLQKFVLALYDRMEQLEAENDLLKSEILSLSNKVENIDDGFKKSEGTLIGTLHKPSKVRKIKSSKTDNENESQSRSQIPTIQPVDPIKSLAANISNSDFQWKPVSEQNRIISSFDEDSAIETVSWAILNTGRIPQIKQEIDF